MRSGGPLLLVVLCACGARSALDDTALDAAAQPAACSASIQTRSGPCMAAEEECGGADDAASCGTCESSETCFQQRCYVAIGLPPDSPSVDVWRAFYDDGEGVECSVPVSGVLERVATHLWEDNIQAVTVVASTTCGGATIQTKVRLPATQLAPWCDSAMSCSGDPSWPTPTIVFNPPLLVTAGGTVRVMFYANGVVGAYPHVTNSGVEEVSRTDVDPYCHFVSTDYNGLPGDTAANWDFAAQLFIHQ